MGVLLQEVETLLMRLLQTLVELVELHQHTGVAFVEMESALHILNSLLLKVLLVETCQSQITPYRRELRVEAGRAFPVFDGDVVLPLVVI